MLARSSTKGASIGHTSRRRRDTLGAEHCQVGITLNFLAKLYADLGRFEEADAQYRRALTILEKADGVDHPSVRIVKENLVWLAKKKEEAVSK